MEIIFPRKNVLDTRIDRGTAACEKDMLPTELPQPVKMFGFREMQLKGTYRIANNGDFNEKLQLNLF